MPDLNVSFEVRRDDLRETRLVSGPLPSPTAGQALLRIDRFGLTSNNVTYGVVGDMIGYWGFFPAEEGWGRIPVWGFADVIESHADGLPAGTRVFGYLPMSSHLLVEPANDTPHGFIDGAAHRSRLPALYNRYRRTNTDPVYSPETEDVQAILFPLFATSFVIDDLLEDNDDFSADRIVLSSASSKTAAGTALCISRRDGPRPDIVGLTSARHVPFVDGLGWYDTVIAYEDVAALDPTVPTVFLDMAGNGAVRDAIHQHLGDRLTASYIVGVTHWGAQAPRATLLGPEPTMFFAPTQVDKRMAEWGVAGYLQRFGAAWEGLLDVVADWIDVVE
ncbi:MAG: DUF2855 family protein, partial [Acidimicrobiia bacterium]|nr:DUF2855 family protein [Acidimicrobiia bacterium]